MGVQRAAARLGCPQARVLVGLERHIALASSWANVFSAELEFYGTWVNVRRQKHCNLGGCRCQGNTDQRDERPISFPSELGLEQALQLFVSVYNLPAEKSQAVRFRPDVGC